MANTRKSERKRFIVLKMKMIGKAKKALKEGGVSLLIRRSANFFYRNLSPVLPYRYSKYNNVKVPSHRAFGKIVPLVNTEDKPEYEKGIIESLKRNIREEDKVVICGGGLGVTAVKSAELNKKPENVEVFEGSESQIEKIEETFQKNNIEGIRIHHSIVGEEKNIWGEKGAANTTQPSELPSCDILEMDIEGSEMKVLEELDIEPRIIIVESHGNFGSPTEEVKKILTEKNYEIKNVDLAEETDHAKENDIKVITGEKA
jgi:hypothetical protein